MQQKKAVKKTVRSRNPGKEDLAYYLYMAKYSQEDICNRVGISAPTLKSWKDSGCWEEKRASRNISLDVLLQKALMRINELLENKEEFSADAFAKAVKQLKELKKSNTIDDDIYTFMAFQDFLIRERNSFQQDISESFIKMVTKYQDQYILYRLGNGKQ